MKFNPYAREVTIPVDELYAAAAGLASDDGENPEYDRALVELICEILGLPTQDGGREIVADQIQVARHLREHALPCE
jgi:hypothetical protein